MEQDKVTTGLPWYMRTEAGKAFQNFYNTCLNKSVLDNKTKELLMLALSSAFRCPHCTDTHVKNALDAGCTKEEITEALLIAALEAGGTQLAWRKETFIQQLGK